MPVKDRTFDITMKCRVTTLAGWEPDRDDVEGWLENGGVLELVVIEKVEVVKQL